jgi:serine/threonine protein kinase
LGEDTLQAFVDGTLAFPARPTAERHLNQCTACRAIVADLASLHGREDSSAQTLPGRLTDTNNEDTLERGQSIGRYVVSDLIGIGGMGVVYAASATDTQRRVALKLLRPDIEDPKETVNSQNRLLREALMMARLSHPNVVALHEVFLFEGQVVLAMELVSGTTLTRWLYESKPTWREVLQVFLAAGKGLAAAHASGLVHRDFKPANVLIGTDGRVRVSDFGIARTLRDPNSALIALPGQARDRTGVRIPQTRIHSKAVAGTPAYMSPEQFQGLMTDPRTDQFSFCAALFEALYGYRPFDGDTFDTLAEAVLGGTPRPTPSDSTVPSWLHEVIARGLRPTPEDRFSSMDELLVAMQAVERPRWRGRRPSLWAAMALGSAVVAGLVWSRGARLTALRAIVGSPRTASALPSVTPRLVSSANVSQPSSGEQPLPVPSRSFASSHHEPRPKQQTSRKRRPPATAATSKDTVGTRRYGEDLRNPFEQSPSK